MWAGLPVSPAIVSWTLRAADGGPLIVKPRIVANFMRAVPANSRFWDVYARGTFQNSARFGRTQLLRLQGRFLFILSHSFDTTRLADGRYVVTVTAQDVRGNHGTLSETIAVANGSSACTGG
jgi:hypothetical protein